MSASSLLLLGLLGSISAEQTSTVRITARAGPPWPKAPAAIRAMARSADGRDRPPIEANLDAHGGAFRGELALSPGKWVVELVTPGGWSPAQEITVAGQGSALAFDLWPTARIVASLPSTRGSVAAPRAHFRGAASAPGAAAV